LATKREQKYCKFLQFFAAANLAQALPPATNTLQQKRQDKRPA
jgi:hypothetical protein